MPRQPRRPSLFLAALCLLARQIPAQWPHPLNLSDVGAGGIAGVRIEGRAADDLAGSTLSGAGDVNGDGFEDFLLGANVASPGGLTEAGEAYLLYGGPTLAGVAGGIFSLSAVDGSNGVLFRGRAAGDRLGAGLGAAGDVNGDGFGDLLLGAYFADPGGDAEAGEGFLVYGAAGGLPHVGGVFDLSALDGANGVRLEGVNPNDRSCFTLSGAGDVNADGFDDVLVCGYRRDVFGLMDAGEAYLLYGSASGIAHAGGVLSLGALNGANGVALQGYEIGDLTGDDVSGAGDVNGDGFADVLINAYQADRLGRKGAGAAYLVYGAAGGLPHVSGRLDLATLTGANGVAIVGAKAGDFLGDMLAGAGDANGDGWSDLIIGARLADGGPGELDRGEVHILYGSPSGLSHTGGFLDLASPLLPSQRTRLTGIDALDWAGFAVAGPGDVNGDGFFDLLIGAPFGSPGGNFMAGEAYLVFGRPTSIAAAGEMSLASLDGSNGVFLMGADPGDSAGVHLDAAGDINGDGLPDFLVASQMGDPPGLPNAGESHLIFGQTVALSATYSAFVRAGDAPRLGVGLTGRGTPAVPAARLWIDFADGAGPSGGASRVSVILERSDAAIEGVPSAPAATADILWELRTDRAGWTSAQVTLRYADDEIASLDESALRLHQAPDPRGPWTELPAQSLDMARNEVRATISAAGFFALATEPLTSAEDWTLFE